MEPNKVFSHIWIGSKLRFLYWMSIFGFFTTMTIYNLVNVIQDYLDHPVITSINLSHKSQVDFPAVTICNQNRYYFSKSVTSVRW